MDKEIQEKLENERAENDLKQHADKIIQSLEKLNETSAKRAIWELFQNAVDLSENCEIIIEQTTDSFNFKHNGKPFTTKTLDCLIIQVSSKRNDNEDMVGQYGTGFLTTHSFGKKILLSSSLKLDSDGQYIDFDKFEIDRYAEDAKQLIKKLQTQRKNVDSLFDNPRKKQPEIWTIFSYQHATDMEKLYAESSINSLQELLPYVMTINKKLKKVTVIDKNKNETVFEKDASRIEGDTIITTIRINCEEKNIYSIKSDSNDLTIILPFGKNGAYEFPKEIPRLFLYYPLIGTEKFGVNYIIHSSKFAPTEARDGIHLKSDNPQVENKENSNREILEKIFNQINKFVIKNNSSITNIHYLAIIDFSTHVQDNKMLSQYFRDYKKTWFDSFKNIPLVESKEKISEPLNIQFFKQELLADKYRDAVYTIVSIFWSNIPDKGIVKEWSNIVHHWEDRRDEEESEIKFITIEQILQKIQEAGTLKIFEDNNAVTALQEFYSYLTVKERAEYFSNFALLPNIKSVFNKKAELYAHSEINDVFVEIADVLIPEIPKHFIRHDFQFNFDFHNYDKKEYSKDINAELSKTDISSENTLPQEKNIALIKYCTIFNSSRDNVKRRNLIKLICQYYNHSPDFIEINKTSQEIIDWRTPEKILLKNFVFELKKKQKFEPETYHAILSVVSDWSDVRELVEILPLFPNQNNQICKKADLEIDRGIPGEMKILFDKVVYNNEKTIKDELLYNESFDFTSFLTEGKTREVETVANGIERKLVDTHDLNAIKDHPFKSEIMQIIKNIKIDSKWAEYFPQISNKKEEIFFVAFDDEEAKEFVFDLLNDNNRISYLKKILDIDNLDEIIELGREAYAKKERVRINWEHKKEIGKFIENLVREKIGKEINAEPIAIAEQQWGQDIIVYYKNKERYYIEIKSRWDTNSTISMSPMQMKTAIKHKYCYALIYVDMCDYDRGDRYEPKIENIMDRIKIITNIGEKVERFNPVFSLDNTNEDVSLINYRGKISQEMIKQTGISLNDFINELIHILDERNGN